MIMELRNFLPNLANLINSPNPENFERVFSSINMILDYIGINTMDGHSLPNQISIDDTETIRIILVEIRRRLPYAINFVNNIQIGRNPIHSLIALMLLPILSKILNILGQLNRYIPG